MNEKSIVHLKNRIIISVIVEKCKLISNEISVKCSYCLLNWIDCRLQFSFSVFGLAVNIIRFLCPFSFLSSFFWRCFIHVDFVWVYLCFSDNSAPVAILPFGKSHVFFCCVLYTRKRWKIECSTLKLSPFTQKLKEFIWFMNVFLTSPLWHFCDLIFDLFVYQFKVINHFVGSMFHLTHHKTFRWIKLGI